MDYPQWVDKNGKLLTGNQSDFPMKIIDSLFLKFFPNKDNPMISKKKNKIIQDTLWLVNIAIENGPFIDDFPSYKPPFIGDFP